MGPLAAAVPSVSPHFLSRVLKYRRLRNGETKNAYKILVKKFLGIQPLREEF
jgi:hypothetical protein